MSEKDVIDRLTPQEMRGALVEILDSPNWAVIEAILARQAKATERNLFEATDAHKMAFTAGKLYAWREVPNLLKTYLQMYSKK